METNRIDYLFGLGGKTATNRMAAKDNGFADLLFGVMSKRADSVDQFKTIQPPALQPLVLPQPLDLDVGHRGDGPADDRQAAVPLHSHQVDKDAASVERKPNSATAVSKSEQAQAAHAPAPAHADKKNDAVAKGGSNGQPATETSMADAASPADGPCETDQPEDSQDVALDSDDDETDSGDEKQSSDQQADPQLGSTLTISPVAAKDTTPVAAVAEVALVPATVSIAPSASDDPATPTVPTESAGTLAAAVAGVPEIDDMAAEDQDAAKMTDLPPAAGVGPNVPTKEMKPAVTFAATAALAEASDPDSVHVPDELAAITVDNDRQIEDPDNLFRRNSNTARKAESVSAGTAVAASAQAQANSAAQPTPDLDAATTQKAPTDSAMVTPATSSAAPAGFDTGFGMQGGLPGLSFQLGQGGAIQRGDLVANLRQHLQNLPVHDQIALTIQRSVREGGGSITLQLSPTELGRIHLKLKIDEENNVQASVVVERPATLDLLQRDMKTLERALQDAGLKAGPGDLSFSLQGGDPEAFARDFGSDSGSGSRGTGRAMGDGVDELPAATAAAVINTGDGWVDVQV
jgi:hypothetical protein